MSYTGALDSTNRLLVEASLGKKWCTWPYNVSPLWNVGAWPTVGMGANKLQHKSSSKIRPSCEHSAQ
jgi:hypothetical protein